MMNLRNMDKIKFRHSGQDGIRRRRLETLRIEKKAYLNNISNTKNSNAHWAQLAALGIGRKRLSTLPDHLNDPNNSDH